MRELRQLLHVFDNGTVRRSAVERHQNRVIHVFSFLSGRVKSRAFLPGLAWSKLSHLRRPPLRHPPLMTFHAALNESGRP